jgi:diguanylate cyclase (GGDEF)-like protein/PAS domain S-box-containing protein
MGRVKEEGMATRQDFYFDLLNGISDGLYFVDRERHITFWNRAAERLTGYEAREVVGRTCTDNILSCQDGAGQALCEEICSLARTIQDGEPREVEVFLHHRQGHRVPVAVRISPLRNAAGEITGAVEVFNDNSRRMAETDELEQLKKLAVIDAMTGVWNRRFLETSLQAIRNEINRYNWPMGLLFVDIDRFKQLNETHGHEAGDAVLRAVAQTLARAVRGYDIVGRWGGEEFVLVVRNVTGKNLARLAEKLRILIAKNPVKAGGTKVPVTVSIGATAFTAADTVAGAVGRAEALMYVGKASGRDRVTSG